MNSCNGRGGPVQIIPACSLPMEWGIEGTWSWVSEQSNHWPSARGEVQPDAKTLTLSSALGVKVKSIWLWNALPQHLL